MSDLLEVPLPSEMLEVPRNELDDRMPLSLLTANLDEVQLADPREGTYDNYVELAVYPP